MRKPSAALLLEEIEEIQADLEAALEAGDAELAAELEAACEESQWMYLEARKAGR